MAPPLKSMAPVHEVLKGAVQYVPHRVGAPRTSGFLLKLFVWIAEARILGSIVLSYFMKLNKFTQMFSETSIPDAPMFLPEYPDDLPEEHGTKIIDANLGPIDRVETALECLPSHVPRLSVSGHFPFRFWSIRDYADAYRSGWTTPTEVAERFLTAVDESKRMNPPMRYFIALEPEDVRRQAQASSQRFHEGKPLSVLDGIFVVVKDDIDCLPYPSKGGTLWLHEFRPVYEDAVCVARLRECGAIFAGKTNMHELGMGTTGNNPLSGTVRNPYDTTRYTGGSSAGSAAVVASGLCPVALGTDSGGSIRIPSALCGIVGLKSTLGRTTLSGLVPVGWTLEVVGPIANCVEDVMLVYCGMLGSTPTDVLSSKPPPGRIPILRGESEVLQQLRLGVYPEWFSDVSSDVISRTCKEAIDSLCRAHSMQVTEIVLPELHELRNGHIVTAGTEICTCLNSIYRYGRSRTCHETRVTVAFFRQFKSSFYVAAQRIRRRLMFYHMEAFKKADVIATPTTGITAPAIPVDAIKTGETDLATNADLMRFIMSPNFLGLPSITVPVGHDTNGLPIGLQLIGRPWQEATLLRIASAVEAICGSSRKEPAVFHDILGSTS